MGCFVSKDMQEDIESLSRNHQVDKIIKGATKGDDVRARIKLLLLGTGDSGKSTFVKQMKVIFKNGFTHNELCLFQNIARLNSLISMQRIISYSKSIDHPFAGEIMELMLPIEEAKELTPEVAINIKKMWDFEEVKKFSDDYENELQNPASSFYYFDNCERFVENDYSPTEEDILRCKLKTTGIIETKFEERKIEFTLVDVGGQRAERRKWLHIFDDVDAVIYLAALDEYNLKLQEDGETNRMEESLVLFRDVTGSQWFSEKSFILFLNKCDLFEKKLNAIHCERHSKNAPKNITIMILQLNL